MQIGLRKNGNENFYHRLNTIFNLWFYYRDEDRKIFPSYMTSGPTV